MNPIIHLFGIIAKYILLNTKTFLKILIQKQKLLAKDFTNVDTIVFTHSLGGGTKTYEKQNFYKKNILIIRIVSYRSDFAFSVENEEFQRIVFGKELFAFLKYINPRIVTVNSLCGYAKPEGILEFIKNNFSHSYNKYLVHDHQCVCNKDNAVLLLNEKYCELKCKGCKFEKKEKKWRSLWNVYFSLVDEVVCFSNSSKEILISAYPELQNKISVVPHSLAYCDFKPLNIDNGTNFAVIGNCSNIPKGKNVIKKLVKAVKKQKKRKLFIIGKSPYFFHKNSKYIEYTGKYNLKKLPEILNSGQIGVIVFTSIWPETFSYAISEFMLLDLYIVSLDLGAQGEKLRNYSKAVFLKDLEPKTILAGVEKCFTL